MEKIMSETNDTSYGIAARSEHELTIDELDAVSGGFEYTERTHGAVIQAAKQEAFPTETIKMTYGAIQWTYT
jgi:bacteriocin-like protein